MYTLVIILVGFSSSSAVEVSGFKSYEACAKQLSIMENSLQRKNVDKDLKVVLQCLQIKGS